MKYEAIVVGLKEQKYFETPLMSKQFTVTQQCIVNYFVCLWNNLNEFLDLVTAYLNGGQWALFS